MDDINGGNKPLLDVLFLEWMLSTRCRTFIYYISKQMDAHVLWATKYWSVCCSLTRVIKNLLFLLQNWHCKRLFMNPSMSHSVLVLLWSCGDLLKNISWFIFIPRKDCQNDVQKCLVPKMKSFMEIVKVAGEKKGTGKSNNPYLGSFLGWKELFEDVELMMWFSDLAWGVKLSYNFGQTQLKV